jgi:hypothetical protein
MTFLQRNTNAEGHTPRDVTTNEGVRTLLSEVCVHSMRDARH